jgi:hypothetical protein
MKCTHYGTVFCEAMCSAGGDRRLEETATSSERYDLNK